MAKANEEWTLTKAELDIMNALWDKDRGMTTHEIIECYPEPRPAYSTIATFLKILTKKGFVRAKKQENYGKTFFFFPNITREAYTSRMMKDVKNTFFGGSVKSLVSFFAEEEELTQEDINEILTILKNKSNVD